MTTAVERPQTVLIMHAPLAQAYVKCVEHIGGVTHKLIAVDIAATASADGAVQLVMAQLAANASQDIKHYLLICDAIGATPYHVACRVQQQLHAQNKSAVLLTGANLPMVWKAVIDTHTEESVFVESILDSAKRGLSMIQNP